MLLPISSTYKSKTKQVIQERANLLSMQLYKILIKHQGVMRDPGGGGGAGSGPRES